MSTPLAGRTAIITGASKGIGRTIALRLAREGCDVAIGYASDQRGAEAVVAAVRDLGRRAFAYSCEVAQPWSIGELFDRAATELGGLDIVVANAGVELIDVPFVDYSEEQYDRVFDVNTKGTFFTLQHAARRIRDRGRIIVICSNTTRLALPGFAVYGASKLAPTYFVEVLAKELGPRGVTVNSVSPGVTEGAGVFSASNRSQPGAGERVENYLRDMAAATPLRRNGTPDDVAAAVALLVSADAGYITGHHLDADGGAAL
ncbi:MAG TPA: SDR family oxidoreductase [Kofleriaceae bacterium]